MSLNSFDARTSLSVDDQSYEIFRIDAVEGHESLPFSLKVLLENLLRTEDGANITADDISALGSWDPSSEPNREIQFTPSRVIMQDFTGVPCIVDLATMREAMHDLGGDPSRINPLSPAEMVIDHSVIAEVFGTPDSFQRNVEIEYQRNRERYQFLRWGQTAFDDFTRRATGHRHRAPGEHRAPRPGRLPARRRRRPAGLPRHPGRHRLAHDHGQRTGGRRVGRRRHRGRGGHARPVGVDADPARRRLQVVGQAARGGHRHRPRPHDHRDAAPAQGGRKVRRVLRRRRGRGGRREPRDHRQHEPRIRVDHRDLPDRREDPRIPPAHRTRRAPDLAGRGLCQGAGAVARCRARAALQRIPRARPRHRRAEHRRPEASARPDRAVGGQAGLRRIGAPARVRAHRPRRGDPRQRREVRTRPTVRSPSRRSRRARTPATRA